MTVDLDAQTTRSCVSPIPIKYRFDVCRLADTLRIVQPLPHHASLFLLELEQSDPRRDALSQKLLMRQSRQDDLDICSETHITTGYSTSV